MSNHQPVGSDETANETQGPLATNIDLGTELPYMVDDSLQDPTRGLTDPVPVSEAVGDLWFPANIVPPVTRWVVTFESGFITVRLDEVLEFGGEMFPPVLYDPNPGDNFQLP